MNLDHIEPLARARALFANVGTVHSSDPRPGEVRHLPIRNRPAPPDEKLDNQTRLAGIIHDHSRTRLPAPQREAISRRLQVEYGGEQAPRVARAVTPKPSSLPKSKRPGGSRRSGIIRRPVDQCNHMHEGVPAWHKAGKWSGEQRYACACCGGTGYMTDGVIQQRPRDMKKYESKDPARAMARAMCTHPKWRKDGSNHGHQRERCAECGITRKAVV